MQTLKTGTGAILALLVWLGLSFAAASVGIEFRPGAWYLQLNKPSWTPPGSVFPPVWTILYIFMAIAAWLVWRRGGFLGQTVPLGLYLLQLFFNGLWSWLFFGLHNPGLAFLDIALLWVSLLCTVIVFFRVEPIAGVLLVPYLLWVTFAGALNFAVWRMN